MTKRSIIKKSRDLIQSTFNMSLLEYQILLAFIKEIDYTEHTTNTIFNLSIKDLELLFKKSINNSRIKKLKDSFLNRKIKIKDEYLKIVDYFEYKNGFISIKFSKDVKNHLFDITPHKNKNKLYDSYEITDICIFDSFYHIRLFELIYTKVYYGKCNFLVDELIEILHLPNTRRDYKSLKNILLNFKTIIEENHVFYFDFEEIKGSLKKIEMLKFKMNFSKNKLDTEFMDEKVFKIEDNSLPFLGELKIKQNLDSIEIMELDKPFETTLYLENVISKDEVDSLHKSEIVVEIKIRKKRKRRSGHIHKNKIKNFNPYKIKDDEMPF